MHSMTYPTNCRPHYTLYDLKMFSIETIFDQFWHNSVYSFLSNYPNTYKEKKESVCGDLMETEYMILFTVIFVSFGLVLRKFVSKKEVTVKQIVFVGIMAAMGTALAVVSFVPIGPNINIDLSHIGTFIVAIVLGPFYGMIAGFLIGFYPMTVFGNPLVPVGKALTGLVVGALAMKFRLATSNGEKRKVPRIVPVVAAGWIPEALLILVTLGILGIPSLFPMPVVETILVKGTAEVILLGILCEFLFASKALRHSLTSLRDIYNPTDSDTEEVSKINSR